MKSLSKKLVSISLIIFVFLGLFLVNIQNAQADMLGIGEGAAELIAQWLIKKYIWSALLISGFLTTIGALIFEGVLNFGFVNLSGIEMGWIISRDIVNMFFILGLVVIAFATILRIETYGMKTLLPKLIIIALLINFSFLICGVIIDATQIMTNFFLVKIKGEPAGSVGIQLLNSLQVTKFFEPGTAEGSGSFPMVSGINNFARFIISASFVALTLMLSFIALIVGAILLLVRLGALWALMILAPFAWFFSIFPGLKAMAGKWWNNFLKYAFFAPIYVFFIYLILFISPHIFNQAQSIYQENVDQSFLQQLQAYYLTGASGNARLIFGFIFVIILMLGAPVIAMSMGLHATSAVVKSYQGIMRGAGRLPWKGIRYGIKSGLQKFDRDHLAPRGLSIRAGLEAWKLRKARLEEEKMKEPIGEWRDKLNRWIGEGKTFYAERARDELRQKHQEIIAKQGLTPEGLGEIANAAKKAVEAGEHQRIHEFKAALMQAVNQGDEEGIMLNDELGAKYGNLTSIKNYQQLIKDVIKDEEEAIRFAGQVGALAKQRGIHYLDGMIQFDPDKKKENWTPTKEEWMKLPEERRKKLLYLGQKGAIELSKLSPRYIYQYSNRRNFMTMNKEGSQEPTELLKELLNRITFDKDHLFDLGRYLAPETVTYIRPKVDRIQKLVEEIKAANPTAQNWFSTLKAKVEGRLEEMANGKGKKKKGKKGKA